MVTIPRDTDVVLFLLQDSKPDDTYFSVDCFHFSEQGHAEMAAALWNNMVSLKGQQFKWNGVWQGEELGVCWKDVFDTLPPQLSLFMGLVLHIYRLFSHNFW